jgi:hypothetical protein
MDLIQALSILSPTEKTEAGLKAAYKKAAIQHHPDKGGSLEIMKLVNAAYDYLKKCESWWTGEQARKAKKTTPLTETMQNMIDKIKTFSGLKIEIIGSWLWVSGETKPVKEELKKSGFSFSFNKKSWYYHEDTYRKRSKKNFSLNDLRNLHGAEEVKTEKQTAIAA